MTTFILIHLSAPPFSSEISLFHLTLSIYLFIFAFAFHLSLTMSIDERFRGRVSGVGVGQSVGRIRVIPIWCWCDVDVMLMWYWCDVDVILMWCWCDIDVILMWCWCDVDVMMWSERICDEWWNLFANRLIENVKNMCTAAQSMMNMWNDKTIRRDCVYIHRYFFLCMWTYCWLRMNIRCKWEQLWKNLHVSIYDIKNKCYYTAQKDIYNIHWNIIDDRNINNLIKIIVIFNYMRICCLDRHIWNKLFPKCICSNHINSIFILFAPF